MKVRFIKEISALTLHSARATLVYEGYVQVLPKPHDVITILGRREIVAEIQVMVYNIAVTEEDPSHQIKVLGVVDQQRGNKLTNEEFLKTLTDPYIEKGWKHASPPIIG